MQREEDLVRGHWAQMRGVTDIFEMRSMFDALGDSMGMPANVAVTPVRIGDRDAEWLEPAGPRGGAVLFLHGGGYMVGSLKSYRHLAAQIAKAASARSLLLDYRLAPEHMFPAALEDALAAYRYLLDEGAAPGRICLMGDSAGGNLVMATLLALRDRSLPLPACAVCFSPWTDYAASGASVSAKADVDPVITPEGLRGAVGYFAGADPNSPPATVLNADLRGLPPLLIQVGSHEVMLDDATQLAARAAHHDVRVTLEVWPRMAHVFQFFHPILEEGRSAIDRAAAFFSRHIENGE